jgi:outer membrane protein TolC
MKNCKILFVLLLSVYFTQVSAQVVSLDSVLKRIESSNPMLKMYDEQIIAINNFSQMTRSWMPTTLSGGLWETPYENIKEGMFMITGEQMIPNPVKQKANYRFMQAMVSVEQAGKGTRQNEMFTMAKKNYYEWVILKRKHDILIQTDSLLNNIIEVARIRYTYNKEQLNNIYKAQADLFELRNMESMLLSDIKMKNIELNTLMNLDVNNIFDVDTTMHIHNYESQFLDTAHILNSRSDIKQFDAQIAMAKLQQQYEKSKRLPDFGISLSHMESLGMMPNQYSAMGMVTIPIAPWASKEYKANIKGLENTTNAITYQKQALTNETAGMISSLQVQMKAMKQQLSNYNENIGPTYYKSFQASLLSYEQNTEDLFVVLDGLKMYRMAKMNELDQLKFLLNLEVEYEKALEIR